METQLATEKKNVSDLTPCANDLASLRSKYREFDVLDDTSKLDIVTNLTVSVDVVWSANCSYRVILPNEKSITRTTAPPGDPIYFDFEEFHYRLQFMRTYGDSCRFSIQRLAKLATEE